MAKIRRLFTRFNELKSDIYVLFLAYRDPRMPRQAKLLAVLTVVYAFSPLDIVSDFIPLMGYLDDLILIPLGMRLAMGMVPPEVLQEYRFKAQLRGRKNPAVRLVTGLIILFLVMAAIMIIYSLTLAPTF
ncbi:hypothetical protein SPSYN_01635 [Sporotomaculum syntrophicum]|uniref:DUF1232 domain-containing protein n=1 Tax=Sporotomaculum syntrophicum TaxID=182264 RepID=A0A9D2WQH5_9FIRM|nr:YkvA family protein [Sporotomaculum syntrophicum]KAF1085493.1 hypothetical protein SPSYN_01635 [Sporotomaculum syntrophicum]